MKHAGRRGIQRTLANHPPPPRASRVPDSVAQNTRLLTPMTTNTRTRTAAFLGMASLLPFHGARLAAAAPEDTPITCVAENHDFTLKSLRGRFIVLHFLGSGDVEAQRKRIATYVNGTRSLAGVHTMFLRSDDESAVRALAAGFARQAAEFAFDAGGRLAREFGLDPAAHVIVALDEGGAELFRFTPPGAGTGDGAAHDMAAFRSRFTDAWGAVARKDYNLPKGSALGVQGYDVVSYFTENKARKGDETLTAEYRGVTYRFATAAHRDAFVAEPRRFVPTYGGWCASAIGAKGEKVSIDPTNFKVKDGRLFLFYKGLFADALKDWNTHEREWEPAADLNWKRISGE